MSLESITQEQPTLTICTPCSHTSSINTRVYDVQKQEWKEWTYLTRSEVRNLKRDHPVRTYDICPYHQLK